FSSVPPAGLGKRGRHIVDKFGVAELATRHVDAHAQRAFRWIARVPLAELATRLTKNPAAQRHDDPDLLRRRDEGDWWDHPALRMIPAQQRLPAHRALR